MTAAEKKKAEAEKAEPKTEGLNILEALKLTESLGKVARKGWAKEVSNTFVSVYRGETLPRLGTEKHTSAYEPSIEDVMANDWYVFEKGK